MNAENYPPLNVLTVFKSVHSEKLPYKITPYRFMMQNGESYKISKIRHYHRDQKGRGEHFHFVVEVGGGRYFRILFDTNTFTWRLIQEVEMGKSVGFGEVSIKYSINKNCKESAEFRSYRYRVAQVTNYTRTMTE